MGSKRSMGSSEAETHLYGIRKASSLLTRAFFMPKIMLSKEKLKMTTENQSEKRPKLILGLKKKTENEQSKTTEGRSRLTLGLRKKTAAISQKENIESPKHDGPVLSIKKKTGITQATQAAPPKFDYNLNIKREVVPQELPSNKKRSAIKILQTVGKLEVVIKINELPNKVETMKHDWKRFWVNAEDQVVQMTVRPKTWKNLFEANQKYPTWMASITGQMGVRIRSGFILLEPSIQIHEVVPKKLENNDL